MMHNKLNLGCGKFSKSGYVNLDLSAETDADIFHNLENFPWLLPDNYFALVEMDHVLEHLSDLRKTSVELSRITGPKGKLLIKSIIEIFSIYTPPPATFLELFNRLRSKTKNVLSLKTC